MSTLSYIRDLLAVAIMIAVPLALVIYSVSVEFAFLFRDNTPTVKRPAPKKFNGSAATFVR